MTNDEIRNQIAQMLQRIMSMDALRMLGDSFIDLHGIPSGKLSKKHGIDVMMRDLASAEERVMKTLKQIVDRSLENPSITQADVLLQACRALCLDHAAHCDEALKE